LEPGNGFAFIQRAMAKSEGAVKMLQARAISALASRMLEWE
jgi:hypothetical protein